MKAPNRVDWDWALTRDRLQVQKCPCQLRLHQHVFYTDDLRTPKEFSVANKAAPVDVEDIAGAVLI